MAGTASDDLPRLAAGAQRSGAGAADVWAGLAAAAVLLPQAMAFGVALFTPLGLAPATGALTALIGAASLSALSGLAGGTRGLISAPTGPTLVLLGGALASLAAAGVAPAQLPVALAAVLLVTGLLQAGIGASGGGHLIKFIPYPVVAGFMTGSAVLMVLSQMRPLAGAGFDPGWESWRWLPVVTAAATFALCALVPRRLPAVPGTIAGLVGGTVLFQLLRLPGPGAVPAAWLIGSLPAPGAAHAGVSLAALAELPWGIVLVWSLALAVLASLDTLLTSVIADVGTGTRHDSRRELIGQGAGQIVAGLLGGMGGAGTTGATLVAVRTGGRRWCGVVAGATFVVLVLFAGGVGAWLPVSVLAGIILHVASSMVERDILAWLRRPGMRIDGGIALLVTGVTVAWDLMIAVGVGITLAVIMYIRAQVRAPVIHRRSDATQWHSVRYRPAAERSLLETHGHRIVLYELRGSLFFGTADRLYGELEADLARRAWVILHLRRVGQVDLTGVKLLQQMANRLHDSGGELIFCHVHEGMGLGHTLDRTLREVSASGTAAPARTFNGADEALEYAEDALLAELGSPPADETERVALADSDLCRDMTPGQTAALQEVLQERRAAPGELLFAAGDEGDELYLVASGEIEIRLPTTRHHYKRLAKYGPGALFGEIAFLVPGQRSAHAVATHASELLVLDRAGFEVLSRRSHDAALAVLLALGRLEGLHLRWSARELRRLEEW